MKNSQSGDCKKVYFFRSSSLSDGYCENRRYGFCWAECRQFAMRRSKRYQRYVGTFTLWAAIITCVFVAGCSCSATTQQAPETNEHEVIALDKASDQTKNENKANQGESSKGGESVFGSSTAAPEGGTWESGSTSDSSRSGAPRDAGDVQGSSASQDSTDSARTEEERQESGAIEGGELADNEMPIARDGD